MSRADIGAGIGQLASHRERFLQFPRNAQLAPNYPQPTLGAAWLGANQMSPFFQGSGPTPPSQKQQQQLLTRDSQLQPTITNPMSSTISPQMYSTIDYVNVNQQRLRSTAAGSSGAWLTSPATSIPASNSRADGLPSPYDSFGRFSLRAQQQTSSSPPLVSNPNNSQQNNTHPRGGNGLKLVCDIDRVFPVPEVNIYSLAKLDGSHPEKLAIFDTRIERNRLNGLFHVQVISVIEDSELMAKYNPEEPIYFECLIALTNLELSKYADNKRSATYWPGKFKSKINPRSDSNSHLCVCV